MNYTRKILSKEMAKSDGKASLIKVPLDRRPTTESLINLEREISSQINANEAMRNRSVQNANKYFI